MIVVQGKHLYGSDRRAYSVGHFLTAPARLTDDPAYTGIQPAASEANLTITQALESPNALQWQAATEGELNQLEH